MKLLLMVCFVVVIQNTATSLENTAGDMSNAKLLQAFKFGYENLASFSKKSQPIIRTSSASPDERSHHVTSSLTPLLDSVIADLNHTANNIKNYLRNDAITSPQDSQTSAGSVDKMVDYLNKDVSSKQEQLDKQLRPVLSQFKDTVENIIPKTSDLKDLQKQNTFTL